MRNVYIVADNIFSPIGRNTKSNMQALMNKKSGIERHESSLSAEPFYAALFQDAEKKYSEVGTVFENIVFASASEAVQQTGLDTAAKKTGFILSTTKGNISLIENADQRNDLEQQVSLNGSADIVAKLLGIKSTPLVVSHACISGLLAMITGMRLIQAGTYDHIVISGADLITSFIYSGFRSFQAISSKPCKPFDASRDGISLGEAATTVVLSCEKSEGAILMSGGSVSNDANHISGPSRTGEELKLAIVRAMRQAGIGADQIDFISAHGTATRYNDEMEAKAFHLAGLENVPVNSLKGFFGHTLGAAGLLESVITMHSMKESVIIPTLGYETPGTEMPVNIVKELKHVALNTCLKSASGFGGCNAAVILQKAG